MTNLGLIYKCLCGVAPATFIEEDNQGMDPLEYAIDGEINIKIIRKMQWIAAATRKPKYYSKRTLMNHKTTVNTAA